MDVSPRDARRGWGTSGNRSSEKDGATGGKNGNALKKASDRDQRLGRAGVRMVANAPSMKTKGQKTTHAPELLRIIRKKTRVEPLGTRESHTSSSSFVRVRITATLEGKLGNKEVSQGNLGVRPYYDKGPLADRKLCRNRTGHKSKPFQGRFSVNLKEAVSLSAWKPLSIYSKNCFTRETRRDLRSYRGSAPHPQVALQQTTRSIET